MTADKRTNLLKFGLLCAILCWQCCAISLWVIEPFSNGNGLSWKRSETEYFGSDFLHYYTAGVMARSRDRLRIYDIPTHFPYMNALISPRQVTQDSCIPYSAPQVAVMSAVSMLPPVPAYLAWTATTTLFGALSLFFLLRRVGLMSSYQSLLFVIFTSASLSSLTALRMGQWSWFLTGLLSCFFTASLNKKEILAALSLGFLIFKPQYYLTIIVVTALQKRFIAIAGVLAIALATSLWGVALIGWDNVLHYPKIIAEISINPALQADALCHCSLRSIFFRLLPTPMAATVTSTIFFSVLGLFSFVCLAKRDQLKENITWVWAIAILLSLIFAPLMFQYDVLLVSVPAALTMRTINPIEVNKLPSAALKVWHWIFLCYPVFTFVRGMLGNEWNVLYAFVNFALLICALTYLKNRRTFEHAV